MSDDNNNEQGFNEDELQDIMSEIESLEKEYVEESSAPLSEEEALQASIDKEIEELNSLDVVDEPSEEFEEESNVVSMVTSSPAVKDEGTYSGSPVEFTANGDMNLSMNFSVGNSTATLVVNKDRGLSVQMEGVNLEITDEGCTVELAGGVKFTVPLTTSSSELNKKVS